MSCLYARAVASRHSLNNMTSPSYAHKALTCYDILATIFDEFATPQGAWYDYDTLSEDAKCWYLRRASTERRVTLARCARVCRAFFAPASAVLWKDVDCFCSLRSNASAMDDNYDVSSVRSLRANMHSRRS